MKNLFIREIVSAQLSEYKKFLSMAIQEDGNNLLVTRNDILHSPFPTKDTNDSFTLGAYSDNLLTGIASLYRDGDGKEKLRHKAFLSTMYVAKEFRGHGIARLLIEEIISRVKSISDIEQINLIVLSNNTKAKQLYEKFGFRKFGVEENSIKWNEEYFSEDFMVLKLT